MSDPYDVLGVDPNASDEAVKKAYRELVKKYHPDSYQDNPLFDLAEEKMKEVNEAYDAIVKERSGGYQSPGRSQGSHYGGQSSASGSGAFVQVRQQIHYGNMDMAKRMLEQMSDRNAEWHYLMGRVCFHKGWLSEANEYFHEALRREPGNLEYRQAVSAMAQQAQRGFQSYQRGGYSGPDCCTTFLCTSCLCNACG